MQFLADGLEIPDELISAQERGEVIFICGAGVSMSIGLPSFRTLVEKVYNALRESWLSHPAEREVMESDGRLKGQYDRCLRALERRLIGSNPRKSEGMRERLRAAVRQSLSVSNDNATDLSNHAALIELSRDSYGNHRLVTTNFDTLFERAWSRGKAPSYAYAAMPQPKSLESKGILHLHGRLKDDKLKLEETPLVLTSAEFGEAYLRSGWASRYVYDLVRAHVVVLVGYSADDPPMRYLLEVLEADRERYSDLHQVYAFAEYREGDHDLEKALWSAKGVTPILHSHSDDGYKQLYETIREWQRYSTHPTIWRREHLRELLKKQPSDCSSEEIERAATLLANTDAGRLINELKPPTDWLGIFDQRKIGGEDDPEMAKWISSAIANPEMVSACAQLSHFGPMLTWHLENALEEHGSTLPGHVKKAWELLINNKQGSESTNLTTNWYKLSQKIRNGHSGYHERNSIAQILRPSLYINKPFNFFDTDTAYKNTKNIHSLLEIRFKSRSTLNITEILSTWPREDSKEIELIQALEQVLNDALEQAESLGLAGSWDQTDHDVPSIAEHPQNRYKAGFYPLVRLLADTWSRLAKNSPASAHAQPMVWQKSRFMLFKRLALFALNKPGFAGKDVAKALSNLSDYDYWRTGASVEIMNLLINRWNDIPRKSREEVEARIALGPPRAIYRPRDDLGEARITTIIEMSALKRLARLDSATIPLSPTTRSALETLGSRYPEWKQSEGDRDDFRGWTESRSGLDGSLELLSEADDTTVVQEAMRIQEEQRFDQGDLWRVLCATAPDRALRGLINEGKNGRWEAQNWREFFWEAGDNDNPEFIEALVKQVLTFPDTNFVELLGTITNWLRRRRSILNSINTTSGSTAFFSVWDRCAKLTYESGGFEGKADYDDVATRALNDPGGELAWALIEDISDAKVPNGSGLPPNYQSRLELAINAPSFQGLLARYQCAGQLSFLNSVAPSWTLQNLLPLFDWSNSEARYVWAANANDHIGSAPLFNALKPNLILATGRSDLPEDVAERLILRLLRIAIWHHFQNGLDYILHTTELRSALTTSSDTVRRTVSEELWHMATSNVAEEDRATHWRNVVAPLFSAIWPLDFNLRSAEVSKNFVDMAIATKDAFGEAVDAITDIIVPFDIYSIERQFGFKRQENLCLTYPDKWLKLLNGIIDPTAHRPPKDLPQFLSRIESADPNLTASAPYRRLHAIARSVN